MANAKEIVMAYQKALGKGDFASARRYMHDDLSFVGPFESLNTPELFAFFSDLAKKKNKEWFTENKERYEKAVQEPSLQFIRDAGSRLQKISSYIVADAKPFGGSLSRIYRDIRFSPDKSPYKTEIGIHFWHAKAPGPEEMAPGYYLHMSSGETMAHSGVWHPDAPVLKKIRERIADEPDAWN